MKSERIIEIHQATAYPSSLSVYHALLQVWNECEQQDNWISVDDRLPPINKIVHFWQNGLTKGKLASSEDGKQLWHYEHGITLTYEKPSHWQPLPNAPKQ